MCSTDHDFRDYAFSQHPDYDEATVRREFAKAVPLRTVVIYCYDPRATGIPEAVARELGDVFPGEVVCDGDGKKIASTATMFEVVVAGGRAVDALRSVTVAQHLFDIENVVVVHHTHCGATSYTAEGIIQAYKDEHDADISGLYPQESVCISDYVTSVKHDAALLRNSPGTPNHINVYGYVYDIDTGDLSKVVEDRAPAAAAA